MKKITMTAGKTAMDKGSTVVNSNTVSVSHPKSLKQQLAKAEKDLKNMTNRNVNEVVLHAQEQVITQLQQEIAQAESKKQASTVALKDDVITFRLAKESKEVSKKIAFVRHNRVINSKKVDEFIAIIDNGKYEEAYPIIVAEAKALIEAGYTVTDINGRELSAEEAEGYYVILDGQHRGTAFAKLNAIKGDIVIPNVYVKEVENIGAYLVDINTVGNWDKRDRLTVAALTSEEALFKNMAELIKEGFNPTTASLIYTRKSISEKALDKVLKGEEYKLPKGTTVEIERGGRFVTLCKAAHITVSFLTKRYFIKGFNSYAKINGEEQAFEALEKLKALNLNEERLKQVKEEDDFQVMLKEALKA
ncbi:hypothetical protein [Bacteroides nordii]|jgi:hypothetical protein|uniref:hypothetical protein n=1 Tax=Bacteroides nordii TaxID=291645 RepID=UPI00189E9078|nr:hypothetical protein [Bacteroides nordii]MCE8466655.1 hypothetical protein [Bacteroides nordii]UYU48282.1 hypothetical protein KQP55_16595 [Bacteroides nordii]